ncbi:pilus assembly PilX family protein [Paenibacillus roseipurpureus]|uniref:Type 4 fimbrial biogenesis protein PilX N-terminal domain-containing protein n=1 Tax=Paenibacillus roseopurpureus TaxID=2918901 RepID=A0AA96LMC4_9BACL|nr:hypothetical protein [Paenibacillus sp. MBLB1832]WNR42373.1 hypothetical protein MJB10_14645 [Paenibacillus sp. MBLB1832]
MNSENEDNKGLQPRPHNEEGSALVIALLAVVLMTMMGLILMGVLRGGAIQAATTESKVQAEAIAQKGLDETLAQIRRAVANGESLGGTNYRSRVRNVDNQLAQILSFIDKNVGDPDNPKDKDGEVIAANKGSYQVDLILPKSTNPESPKIKPVTTPDSPYVRKFIVTSRGFLGDSPSKIVTKQMTVYVSTINPVFRYPVSSGGDLVLNGTPSIVGDLYVANHLHLRDEALFTGATSGTNRSKYGIQTGLPAIRGFIRVNGDVDGVAPGKFNLTQSDGVTEFPPISSTSEIVQPSYFAPQTFPLEDPTLDADVDVDVQRYVSNKTVTELSAKLAALGGYKEPDPTLLEVPLFSDLTKSTLYNDQWITVQGGVNVKDGASAANEADVFVNNGVLTMDSSSSKLTLGNGSLYVKSSDPNLVAADLRGELSVEPGKFVAVDGNVTLNNGFRFPHGTMYIKGDLKIVGNVWLQGTVYVDGNVELKQMTSINKENQGVTSSSQTPLIVVASGEIVLGNSTNAGDEDVRAFFYTKQGIRLYGVMSKLTLKGGIHGGAGGVELNAVRGDLTSGGGSAVARYQGAANWNKDVPEVQLNNTKPSRLQIFYDDNLYDSPPDGIPTTDQFNVFVKNVQYIK